MAVRPINVKNILKACFEIEEKRDGGGGPKPGSAVAVAVTLAASRDTTS